MHLGLQGDLPALAKAGGFKRSYSRVPRSVSGKSVGICFLCLAGRETCDPVLPYEDFSRKAAWKDTYLTELPYDQPPYIMHGLPWGPPSQGPWFFKHDFWHNWHNGVAKNYIASAFVVINQARLLGNSIDARFQSLTTLYKDYCSRVKLSPYLKELSRDTFNMETTKVFPVGSWNKAVVSTQLMLFLEDFCKQNIQGKTDDPFLLAIVACLMLCIWFVCPKVLLLLC